MCPKPWLNGQIDPVLTFVKFVPTSDLRVQMEVLVKPVFNVSTELGFRHAFEVIKARRLGMQKGRH